MSASNEDDGDVLETAAEAKALAPDLTSGAIALLAIGAFLVLIEVADSVPGVDVTPQGLIADALGFIPDLLGILIDVFRRIFTTN